MPKNSTKTLLIFLLILDLTLCIIFSGLYLYMKKEVVDSNNKEYQIKKEIQKKESRSLMQDDLKNAIYFDDKIKEFLVGRGDVAGFIKTLEDLISNSNLNYEVKNVSTKNDDSLSLIDSEQIILNVDVTGEWKNINFFLNLLENYPLQIHINKVSLVKFSDYVVKDKIMPQWLGSFQFTVVKLRDNK